MSDERLISVELDQETIGKAEEAVEHERRVAIADLLEANTFAPEGGASGPYALRLAIEDQRLVFDVKTAAGEPVRVFVFSLGPLRRIIKDYFLMCESYYAAVRDAPLGQIEAID
ncbi:MAG: UPF0262 family protein, partial [Oceanicaulis sp.]